MADLISRAAAIEAVRKEEEYYERSEDYDCMEAVQSARWRLEEVPVVDAIPVEWILHIAKTLENNGSKYRSGAIRAMVDLWNGEIS